MEVALRGHILRVGGREDAPFLQVNNKQPWLLAICAKALKITLRNVVVQSRGHRVASPSIRRELVVNCCLRVLFGCPLIRIVKGWWQETLNRSAVFDSAHGP